MSDHVDNHVDHLFFLVRDLVEVEGWQMQLVVALEDIFKGWQGVDNVPVVIMRMLIYFHSRRTAAHFDFRERERSKLLTIIFLFLNFMQI